ncbi:hypothetical protein CRE_01171 [Caenorhabditis remanei]|uniref:Protein kinase domain-containing protein n=1 Tax=Caenorhabditis remanei TaxID=31234 RepID=E3MWD5_CAERE|nr:hypothetical protein CRE_01171 [Caenorhabditis remanei]
MKCVGKNLWDIRVTQEGRKYTLSTTMKIAEQTLAALRDLHRVGYLHRDIKPPNFAAGREGEDDYHTVYVLDFGLCRRIALKGKDLRTPRKECAFRGTTRYASLAAHEGKDQSRKDDLESWWYMILEMIAEELPWKKLKDRDAVREVKLKLRTGEQLKFVLRSGCYTEMNKILVYLDQLVYTSIPDYDFVYKCIRSSSIGMKCNRNDPPDWDANAKEYRGPAYKLGEPYIVKALE